MGKNPDSWTDEENELLSKLWEEGTPKEDISIALNRSVKALSKQRYNLKLPPRPRGKHGKQGAAYKRRSCMCCGKPFPSTGPENRLCKQCKTNSPEYEEYTTPYPHLVNGAP